MKYSINPKYNEFMEKIFKKLESLISSDFEGIFQQDGSDYSGYWSHTIGDCKIGIELPFEMIAFNTEYSEIGFANKKLDEELSTYIKELRDSFEEDEDCENWEDYVADLSFLATISVMLKEINERGYILGTGFVKESIGYDYVVEIHSVIKVGLSYFRSLGENMINIPPVFIKDGDNLEDKLNEIYEKIDLAYNEYKKIIDLL